MDMDFNDVKRIVGDTAKTVAKKSGEALEYGKIKYAIYDIQNDISKIFTQIGQDVYESYKNGDDAADFSEKCKVIDEKKCMIEELQADLAALKNSKKCSECGKMAKKDDAYCPACGQNF